MDIFWWQTHKQMLHLVSFKSETLTHNTRLTHSAHTSMCDMAYKITTPSTTLGMS